FLTEHDLSESERAELRQELDSIDLSLAQLGPQVAPSEDQAAAPIAQEPVSTEPDEGATVVPAMPQTEVMSDTDNASQPRRSRKSPEGAASSGTTHLDGLASGTIIGNYEIIELIGRGGMGEVYRARQRQMKVDRIVALKLIRVSWTTGSKPGISSTAVVRFQVEMMAAARLEHDHIVPVYEVGEHEGYPYYSMLFVDGSSLSDLLAHGPIPAKEAAAL